MKCPHCGVEAKFDWNYGFVNSDSHYAERRYKFAWCPSDDCANLVLYLGVSRIAERNIDDEFIDFKMIEPMGANRGPVPAQVPALLAADYVEACNVLAISAKASAALSRRCLQAILRANGYKAKDLAKEIDLLLDEPDPRKAIPDPLRTVVDAVRNFGNFSAHPITDVTTLQIIDVEDYEAEWCLEVIEECFQHFYVRPAAASARKAALDVKLAAAGKHPSKG